MVRWILMAPHYKFVGRIASDARLIDPCSFEKRNDLRVLAKREKHLLYIAKVSFPNIGSTALF
jgi:hypothetical protein